MKTASQNLLSVIKGKKVLFLENDSELYDDLGNVETFLINNNVPYTAMCSLKDKPFSDILEAINKTDILIFQTQWVYDISKRLKEYVYSLKSKKIIIEVYIYDPTWFYKPKVVHDVYILKTNNILFDGRYETDPTPNWEFYKLRPKKPFWTYKNKFNN